MNRIAWYVILSVAVIYGSYAVATVDRRSDDEQISSLIDKAVESVQRRDVGGAISVVSKSFKDENDLNYDRLRLVVAQAFRTEQKYTITARAISVRITGSDALAEVHASVVTTDGSSLYNRRVTVVMKKEPARHMLIVPVKVWRVVSTRNLGLNYAE